MALEDIPGIVGVFCSLSSKSIARFIEYLSVDLFESRTQAEREVILELLSGIRSLDNE